MIIILKNRISSTSAAAVTDDDDAIEFDMDFFVSNILFDIVRFFLPCLVAVCAPFFRVLTVCLFVSQSKASGYSVQVYNIHIFFYYFECNEYV